MEKMYVTWLLRKYIVTVAYLLTEKLCLTNLECHKLQFMNNVYKLQKASKRIIQVNINFLQ